MEKVTLEIWDDDYESNTLVARVSVEKDKSNDFIKKVEDEFHYRVEEAEPIVDSDDWFKVELKRKRLRQKQMKEAYENMSEEEKNISDYLTKSAIENCKPMFNRVFKK